MLNHNVAWGGGTFFRAYHFARHLTSRGHSVTLLTISPDALWGFRRQLREGVEVVETPDLLWGIGRTGWDLWDISSRLYFLHGKIWDIVHAWDCRPAVIFPALFARRQSRTSTAKLVIDWCDWWGRGGTQSERSGKLSKLLYGPIETYFEEAFRADADATTVISEALYRRALGLNISPGTIQLLPQGCDVAVQEQPSREEARRRLQIPQSQPLILSVGALTNSEAKLLFETVSLLLERRTDFKIVMIGKHRAPVPAELKKHAQFVEAGFVSDATLNDYVSACSALLVPLTDTIASRARWPSKVNPFLAAGRVVVITDVGDLARLLKHEEAGIVCRCDAYDIVNNLIRLFDNPQLRRQCELRARSVAERLLAWPIITGRLESLYEALQSNRPLVEKGGNQ
jgi:glycosyltransferase involved in cell wall biosynthesis